MNASDGDQNDSSRRAFLRSGGGWLSSAWILAQWPAIAAAAHHAAALPSDAAAPPLQFFSAANAADVAAIAAQIVPSTATPGATEARVVYFIDRSFATYFAGMAAAYAMGLVEFQAQFHAANPHEKSFASAGADTQTAFLKTVDRTPFFESSRLLTVLGMFSSPKYGGNYQASGWKLMGFVDQHAFAPPFGYYDAEYKGFVPYAEKPV
jgi:gluconate 2-dehydrogenase gamma chain